MLVYLIQVFKKFKLSGAVTTIVNSTAGLKSPTDVAVTSNGVLYVTDTGNNIIRKVLSSGIMRIFAGRYSSGFVDGYTTSARFNSPSGVAADTSGTLYVADTGNHRLRKITSSGWVSTLAGSTSGYADGMGTNALMSSPYGVALDPANNIYVTDNNALVRFISSFGVVTTLAGSTSLTTGFVDGYGTAALFSSPRGIDLDTVGLVYVADLGNQRIRRLDLNGNVRTIGGNGETSYLDGAGTHATLNSPWGTVVDSAANVYFTSTGYGLIREITTNGIVITMAGSISSISAQDGLGTSATFEEPKGISIDTNGDLYVVNSYEATLRKISVHNGKSNNVHVTFTRE